MIIKLKIFSEHDYQVMKVSSYIKSLYFDRGNCIFRLTIFLTAISFPQDSEIGIKELLSKQLLSEPKLYHYPPDPLFMNRPFSLDMVMDIPDASAQSILLFFKTDQMKNYREISLKGNHGLYRFKVKTDEFPGQSINYFFVVRTNQGKIYGAPLDSKGIISPVKRKFVDPIQYYERKKRLNQ